jgi:hypothetical protein
MKSNIQPRNQVKRGKPRSTSSQDYRRDVRAYYELLSSAYQHSECNTHRRRGREVNVTFEKYKDRVVARDVIARRDELEQQRNELQHQVELANWDAANGRELTELVEICKACENGGGLIRDSALEDYAQDLAKQRGVVEGGVLWPTIDWQKVANAVREKVSRVELGGVVYFVCP